MLLNHRSVVKQARELKQLFDTHLDRPFSTIGEKIVYSSSVNPVDNDELMGALADWLGVGEFKQMTYHTAAKMAALSVFGRNLLNNTWITHEVLRNTKVAVQIGAGMFGTVYCINDSDRVVKITQSINSDCWFSWAKACEGQHTNSMLPMIHCAYNYDRFAVVEMEKLEDLSKSRFVAIEKEIVNVVERGYEPSGEWFRDRYGMDPSRTVEELLHARTIIKQLKHRCSGRADLHGNNIMVRNGEQIVITDPLAYGEAAQFKCRRWSLTDAKIFA